MASWQMVCLALLPLCICLVYCASIENNKTESKSDALPEDGEPRNANVFYRWALEVQQMRRAQQTAAAMVAASVARPPTGGSQEFTFTRRAKRLAPAPTPMPATKTPLE